MSSRSAMALCAIGAAGIMAAATLLGAWPAVFIGYSVAWIQPVVYIRLTRRPTA